MIDEFIQKNEKVLTIENPISLFRKVLSQVGTTEQRTERWQTLNTLMSINNHRRIDHLESNLLAEQARVRFLEDFSHQMEGKVGKMEKTMESVTRQLKHQKKTLSLILSLVRMVTEHAKTKSRTGLFVSVFKNAAQNALIFGAVQVLMKVLWVDSMIDGLVGLLRLTQFISKRSMERSRFLVKLSVSFALFMLLRRKIMKLLSRVQKLIPFIL